MTKQYCDHLVELFGVSTTKQNANWESVVAAGKCPYLKRKCLKNRKSQPNILIGTCTVVHGKNQQNIIICPHRLLDKNQIFIDSMHLLTLHEPGNEIHVVPEISVPGGSVDYFLVSVRDKKIKDFVGIELQAIDTTGTVWPARQKFLHQQGIKTLQRDRNSSDAFGINWKMTAKTILVQLHHKVETFEYLSKK